MTDQPIRQLQAAMQRFVAKRRSVSTPGFEISVVEDKGRMQLRVQQVSTVLHVRPTLKGAACLADKLGVVIAMAVICKGQ